MTTIDTTEHVPPPLLQIPGADTELQNIATQFLALESKLLDEAREEEWYQLLDPELLYVIPIRQATEQRSDEVNRAAFRVRDTLAHVRLRIDRLSTAKAYSEIPPSRTMSNGSGAMTISTSSSSSPTRSTSMASSTRSRCRS